MKKSTLIIVLLIIGSLAYSQSKICLLDGTIYNSQNYIFYDDIGSTLELRFEKKNGKIKTKFLDINDVWSVNDSILYLPTEEEEFSVPEMKSIVLGKQQATMDFNPWWAGVSGFIVGAGSCIVSSHYSHLSIGLATSIVYAGGISFVRPSKKYIYKHYPQYADNEYFAYGYQSKARKKIFTNVIIGTVSGIVVGCLTSFFLPRTNNYPTQK